MSLITRLKGVSFSDLSMQKLYRDSVINSGTKFLFDALDKTSFPDQAPVGAGGSMWKSLSNLNTSAEITGPLDYASGGFKFTASGIGESISLPSSGVVAAGSAGFVVVAWIKWGTQTSDYNSICGHADTTSLCPWWFVTGPVTGNSSLKFIVNGNTIPASEIQNIPAGTKMQVGIAIKRESSGKLTCIAYRDGVETGRQLRNETLIQQPVALNPKIGGGMAGYSVGWAGEFNRILFDDLSFVSDPSSIVAADFAANKNRF